MAYERERTAITSFQTLKRQIREKVDAYAQMKWGALRGYRDAEIDAFVSEIVPVVMSGQKQVSQLTIGYLDTMARLAGLTPLPVDVIDTMEAFGIDPDEAYRRSGKVVWTALSQGRTLEESAHLAAQRVRSLVDTHIQIAHTNAARTWTGGNGFRWYRRSLTGAENCALCVIASTQRYKRGDLMPIHPGCDCSVVPMTSDYDPGQVVNDERLDAIYSALEKEGVRDSHSGVLFTKSGERIDGVDLMHKIAVREHGEYGPTLTWKADRFTGPSDIQ